MIEIDKIYVINMNDLTRVECFSIKENTAKTIATYFIGKIIYLQNKLLCSTTNRYLLCRPGYRSIILKSYLYTEMIKEVQQLLEEE